MGTEFSGNSALDSEASLHELARVLRWIRSARENFSKRNANFPLTTERPAILC